MKKFFRIFALVVLAALVVGVLYFLYERSRPKEVTYQTSSPFISDILKKTVATGSVVPRKEILIKPQVSGIIEKVYIEAGAKVKKGDIIARIKIIPDMVNLNSADSRLSRAKIGIEDARIDFNRKKELYNKKVISNEEYLKSKLAFDNAREELDAAESNLELVKNGVTRKSKSSTNTLIRSTIDGTVLDVPVKEGNSVIQSNTFNDGTTIATVADMNDMIFQGKVDETEVGKIHEGMKIVLTIGAIDNERYDAQLTYISPKGKEENGAIQFEIRAKVNLKQGQFIRAGYSANAAIVLDRRDQVMVSPEGLLKFEKDKAYVEIEVAPKKYEKRYVVIGLSDGVNIEVKKGLGLKDKIKGKEIDDSAKK
ncbi:MAG: efflux RND transporter periplasmic adaptor subunit, partial [Bacteroidota bacterium]|nr:efflux RND transporter periplasmic adaptor subunit [Bacteroidota bacterium]